MTYEAGRTYDIDHSRKGRMTIAVTAVNGEWIKGTIVTGTAKMLSVMNEDLGPGEELTFRDSLARILAVHPVAENG